MRLGWLPVLLAGFLWAGAAFGQSPGTVVLHGPSYNPALPQVTPEAVAGAVNTALSSKQDVNATINGQTQTIAQWLALFSRGAYESRVTCAASDVGVAMMADMAAALAAGQTTYVMSSVTPCLVASTQNFVVPDGLRFTCGSPSFLNLPNSNYKTQPCTLLVGNPAYTVTNAYQNSAITWVNIVANSMPASITTMRQSLNAAAAFAGTGLTCAISGHDFTVSHVNIIGFQTALNSGCDRIAVDHLRADSTNCVVSAQGYDAMSYEDIECTPITSYSGDFPQFQISTIASLTNSGGLIEVTLGAAPVTPIISGDTVVLASTGVSTANGRWTATAIDTTHFTLNGSTYTAGATTGTVLLNTTLRTGTGFDVESSGSQPIIYNLLTYGYTTGLKLGNGAMGVWCTACWIDSYTVPSNADQYMTGILQTGPSGGNHFSGFINVTGPAIVNNGTNGLNSVLSISDSQIGALGWMSGVYSIQANAGITNITGGFMVTTNGPQNEIYVSNSGYFRQANVINLGPVVTVQQSSAACPNITVDGVEGPCPYTPILFGQTTPGTITYSTPPLGYYTVTGAAEVDVWGKISASSITGAVGPALIKGWPTSLAPGLGGDWGACSFGLLGGITLSGGYTQVTGNIPTSVAAMSLFQFGSGQGAADVDISAVANTATLQYHCRFHL